MFNIGILGCGNIAGHMAEAISKLDNVCLYAVGCRDEKRGREFVSKWNADAKVYSYDELAKDSNVDLVYIATPHTFHYDHAMLCMKEGRNVLVEKPFAINVKQASAMIEYAKENDLFIQEAMWTRFVPGRAEIDQIIAGGELGEVRVVEADFSINLSDKERLVKPELGGGALLDLGIYCLTIAHMFIDEEIESIATRTIKFETGVDGTDYINIKFKNDKEAILKTSMMQGDANHSFIYFDRGYIYIEANNCIQAYKVFNNSGDLVEEKRIDFVANAYEYEVMASVDAIERGWRCCDEMTSDETLKIMREMDALRKEWGVVYPMD